MKEYMILVHTVELSPAIEDATADEITDHFTLPLTDIAHEVTQYAETIGGGGWEVVSHTLTKLHSHLLLTFLLCR